MRRNKSIHTAWLRRFQIAFTIYCIIVTVAAIIAVNISKHKANEEIRQYHEQMVQEMIEMRSWTSGEYPQWFIEWLNTQFYE